jgi:hypothetical protein
MVYDSPALVSRGCSSMVERQLPKLHTRVRFPSPAPHQVSGDFRRNSKGVVGHCTPHGSMGKSPTPTSRMCWSGWLRTPQAASRIQELLTDHWQPTSASLR